MRVDVRTDYVPVAEFAELEVSLDDGDSIMIHDASFDEDYLMGVRVASLEAVFRGSHTVRARMRAADGRRLAQRVVAIEVDGPQTVTLVFTRDCAGIECPGDGDVAGATECLGGLCVTPECTPENPRACGATQCTADSDCPGASVGCTRPLCSDGTCFVGTDSAACASSEYCNPEVGCVARPTGADDMGTGAVDMGTPGDGGADVDAGMADGGPIDMGLPEECGQPCDTGDLCEQGIYSCATGAPVCVRDRLLDAGTPCRPSAGSCDVAETCDGASPACPLDQFAPTGLACADGFCDGLGTCASGCTPGATCSTGNLCATGTISCDTGAPVCVRSGNAPNGTMCAATDNGAWGSCGGFGGTCGETGSRSRTVTIYACQSGACTASSSPQSEPCSRSTDGTSCGAVTYGDFGACGGFSDTCDTTGTRSRPSSTPTCSGGTCTSVAGTDTGSCSRSTEGNSCGGVTYGTFGACTYESGMCDETGSRTRTSSTPTCQSGTCTDVAGTDTDSCTRDTDGLDCGSQERLCLERFCTAGVCEDTFCPTGFQCCRFDGCFPDGVSCP